MNVLASFGNSGMYLNNVTRDLRRTLRFDDCDLPEPYGLNLEIWSPMLHLPHVDCIGFPTTSRREVMASMFEHCPAEFQDWVSGEPGAVREFWRSVKARDPRCMLAPPFDVRDVCIPLRITVTGCLMAKVWSDPLTVLSFSSILDTPRNTEGLSSSPSASLIPASRQCDGTEWTRCRIWETAIWSFRWLMHGTWPNTDLPGN